MKGLIALLGSGEYLPVMVPVDRFLLESLDIKDRPPRLFACRQLLDRKVRPVLNAGRGWGKRISKIWVRM